MKILKVYIAFRLPWSALFDGEILKKNKCGLQLAMLTGSRIETLRVELLVIEPADDHDPKVADNHEEKKDVKNYCFYQVKRCVSRNNPSSEGNP